MVDPPSLPTRLTRMSTVVAAGTGLWVLGAVALLTARMLGSDVPDVWLTTCVAGAALGGIGYSVFAWQRAAGRRGSRTAQPGLE